MFRTISDFRCKSYWEIRRVYWGWGWDCREGNVVWPNASNTKTGYFNKQGELFAHPEGNKIVCLQNFVHRNIIVFRYPISNTEFTAPATCNQFYSPEVNLCLQLVSCRHLAISSNTIEKICCLGRLKNLRVLSIGRNQIRKLDGLEVWTASSEAPTLELRDDVSPELAPSYSAFRRLELLWKNCGFHIISWIS